MQEAERKIDASIL